MRRLKNTFFGLVVFAVALGLLGFFAGVGLAVLGFVVTFACAAALAGWVATIFTEKRERAEV